MGIFLRLLLLISLVLNAYLLWQMKQQSDHAIAIPTDISSPNSPLQARGPEQKSLTPSISKSTRETHDEAIDGSALKVPSEGITLAFLQQLQQAKAFDSLSFYVSAYLRENPQDIDALLLEAEAYFYTQPLNIALVNYYGLRDAYLTDEQLAQINRLIDVNTTRIIQQFSGDGSWDLLAAFLEPLIQVDPLNRRYILALAKAYGMQEQTILMENVLAALPSDDARAQRLRNDIYNLDRVASIEQQPKEAFSPNPSSNIESQVRLIARNGQYYTDVRLSSVDAQLLVDTGASTTAISQQVFNRITSSDTNYLGTFQVQTAGGNIASPIYRIAELVIGEERLSNVSVMVLPTENLSDFDGLLGMNVIKRFNISYDQATGNMRMYKQKGPTR
jgi:clan AA aspartic protease (TIGR02281 family)